MKSPCELVVWYVLPSIKSDLTKELINRGMSQKDVASMLGLTEAAVSQYVKGKRGGKIQLEEGAKDAIGKLADEIVAGGQLNLITEVCRVCGRVKADRTLCGPHMEYELVPKGCDACFIP
ncbi:MAG: transcriptional regulator [Candidatus Hydrothermarchaeaceae archaeon]